MKEIESYSNHPRAQAADTLCKVFKSGIKVNNTIALLRSLPGHEGLASQLMEGMCLKTLE